MTSLADKLAHLGPVIETHSAWVFLGERFVLKTKKPVDLGFLDFSTLDRRREMCGAEVELNQRLAPGVYLGVVGIFEKDGVTFADDPDLDSRRPADVSGAALVDFGVKMRRLRDDQRADHLLGEGALDLSFSDRVARTMADFHRRCETSPEISRFGSVGAVRQRVEENFAQARPLLAAQSSEVAQVEGYQLSFLDVHRDLFERRLQNGFVRDGHGDLRLEHLYVVGDELVVIDCIEFNDGFRYADVVSDLAFLTMDLRHNSRSDLAERLLAQYADSTRDYEMYRVVDFYESYRAFVRAKVTAILRAQMGHGQETSAMDSEVKRFCEQAVAASRAGRERPRIICVGGMIASGKTTVTARLRDWLCPIVVDSDTTRKHLHGLERGEPRHDPAFEGMYAPAQTKRVYEALRRDAGFVLESRRSVIVEASFSKSEQRRLFVELASAYNAELYYVECRVPQELAQVRLARRANSGGVSDGRLEIYDSFVAESEPFASGELPRHLVLRTERAIEEQEAELAAFLAPG